MGLRTRVDVGVVGIKNEELVWIELELVALVSVALMHVQVNNHPSFDWPPGFARGVRCHGIKGNEIQYRERSTQAL